MKIVAFIVLFLSALTVKAESQPDLGTPYRVEKFNVTEKSPRIEVTTSGGHIYVVKESNDYVRVEMFVRKNGKSYTQKEMDLDDYSVVIQKMGNTIMAVAKSNKGFSMMNWDENYSIHFIVYTPRSINAELKTSGGHIGLMGVEGVIDAKTSGGHINGEDMEGMLTVKTSGGHIELNQFEGQLEASTSGGHITLNQVSGNLTFSTSGGHLRLNSVAGTINGKTSGGNISGDIKSITSTCALKTSGGNISIKLPSNEGYTISARGSLVRSSLSNFSGSTERDEITGSVRNGGSSVTLKTSGGVVTISEK